MNIERLVSRLEGVKQTGPDRWLGRCPAHHDHSPSLAIREIDDRLLLHCFAGCSVYEVVTAVGLEVSDLFPERVKPEGYRPTAKPFPAQDILLALANDSVFVMFCADDLAKGKSLNEQDRDSLALIAARYQRALIAGRIAA